MVRSIGFGQGITGAEILDRMPMSSEDLVDVLNSLIAAGLIETGSMKDSVTSANFAAENYEINPSYSTDLRDVLKRR